MAWPDADVLGVVVFLSSLLVLGMPHGAIDHHLYFRLIDKPMTSWPLFFFVMAYLGVAGLMFGLWWLVPFVGVWGLIVLTWYHWGEGDLLFEARRGNRPGLAFGVWRGALPMLLPVLLNPEVYVRVLEGALFAMGSVDSPGWVNWVAAPPSRIALAVLVLVLGCVAWVGLCREPTPAPLLQRYAVEDVVLVNLFLWLDPLLSIGIYFIFWHSMRHVRVSATVMGETLWNGRTVRWGRFYALAFPFTLAGVFFLLLIHVWAIPLETAPYLLVGIYLVLLWALTWPHALICHLMGKYIKNSGKPICVNGNKA